MNRNGRSARNAPVQPCDALGQTSSAAPRQPAISGNWSPSINAITTRPRPAALARGPILRPASGGSDAHDRPKAEFPGPAQGRVEGHGGAVLHRKIREGQTKRRDHGREDDAGQAECPNQRHADDQEQRPGEVELLFDTQGPGVQQRQGRRRVVEIARLSGKIEMESRLPPSGCFAKLGVVRTQHQHVAGQQRHRNDQHKSGIDAQDAPPVESPERERPGIDLAQDDPGNQKAADDEENVDPDESARSHTLLI